VELPPSRGVIPSEEDIVNRSKEIWRKRPSVDWRECGVEGREGNFKERIFVTGWPVEI